MTVMSEIVLDRFMNKRLESDFTASESGEFKIFWEQEILTEQRTSFNSNPLTFLKYLSKP